MDEFAIEALAPWIALAGLALAARPRALLSLEARASARVSPQLAAVATLIAVAALYGSLGPALRGLFMLDGPPTPATLSFVRQVMTVGVFLPMLPAGATKEPLPPRFWPAACELAMWNFGSQGFMNAGLALTDATRAAFFMQLSVAITPAIALAAGDAVSAPLIGASGLAFLGVLLLVQP